VVASLDRVYSNLFQRGLIILVTQGIKTFIVSIVILLAFHWMVTQHLYRIGQYAKQVDLGSDQRLRIQRAPGTNDELDFIVQAINEMRDNIQHGYRTIASSTKTSSRRSSNARVRFRHRSRSSAICSRTHLRRSRSSGTTAVST
jgi:methyl-accepting chemotaxis protein